MFYNVSLLIAPGTCSFHGNRDDNFVKYNYLILSKARVKRRTSHETN